MSESYKLKIIEVKRPWLLVNNSTFVNDFYFQFCVCVQ